MVIPGFDLKDVHYGLIKTIMIKNNCSYEFPGIYIYILLLDELAFGCCNIVPLI